MLFLWADSSGRMKSLRCCFQRLTDHWDTPSSSLSHTVKPVQMPYKLNVHAELSPALRAHLPNKNTYCTVQDISDLQTTKLREIIQGFVYQLLQYELIV